MARLQQNIRKCMKQMTNKPCENESFRDFCHNFNMIYQIIYIVYTLGQYTWNQTPSFDVSDSLIERKASLLHFISEGYNVVHSPLWASLVAQMVKNLPAMQETWLRSLGWEHPLEKEMATHSSIFA